MTRWKVYLIFIDNTNSRKTTIKHSFRPLYTYRLLLSDLDKLYKKIDWKVPKGFKITFKLSSYRQNPELIDDLDRYILNRDKIEIVFYNPKIINYGLFSESDELLLRSSSMITIYNDIEIDKLNQTLLLYTIDDTKNKIKLIDVIDNPKRLYNELINRMVKRSW